MKRNWIRARPVALAIGIGFSLAGGRAGAAEELTTTNETEPPFYRPLTLSLEAGTTGAGGALSYRFLDHWGVRAGANFFSCSAGGVAIKDLTYNVRGRLLSEPLTLDFYPWKAHSFHISAGVMFNQNMLLGDSTFAGGFVKVDGFVFPAAALGSVHLEIKQQLVNPYLSIGGNFFYFDHAHRWALGGELGVAYTGDPQVSLSRLGSLSVTIGRALASEQDKVHDWAKVFMWWPVAKIYVSYSF